MVDNFVGLAKTWQTTSWHQDCPQSVRTTHALQQLWGTRTYPTHV